MWGTANCVVTEDTSCRISVLRRRNSGQADPAEPPTVQTLTPVSSSLSCFQSVPVQTDITDMAARKRYETFLFEMRLFFFGTFPFIYIMSTKVLINRINLLGVGNHEALRDSWVHEASLTGTAL